MEIIEIDHSIANRYEDHIEINKDLKKYPKLYRSILNHELKHQNGGFSMHDLKLDMYERVNNWEMAMFIFHHPKSLFQFVPFYYTRKKGFVYDSNLIILYIILCSLISLGIYTAFRL